MSHERLIIAIGRIEHALSKIERSAGGAKIHADPELMQRHAKLKLETQAIIGELDRIIIGAAA